jgi:hypothetical protein
VCQLLRTYTSLYGRLGASWKGGHERKQPVLRSWRNHGNCGVSLDEIILSFFPAQKWGVVSTVWRSRVSFSRVHVTFTHTSVLSCSLSLSLSASSSSLSGQVLLRAYGSKRYNSCSTIFFVSLRPPPQIYAFSALHPHTLLWETFSVNVF